MKRGAARPGLSSARRLVAATLLALSWSGVAGAADFAAGVAAYDRGEYAAAYEAWLPLARDGDPAAQRNIGHLYRFGLGTTQDFGQAAHWYGEAASAGLAGAQANLAMMYLRGQGVGEDASEAAYWLQLAAAQGHAVAQYNLGLLYISGNGVAKSEPHAMAWFYLAAKAGHQKAMQALSKLVLDSATLIGPPPPPGWEPSDKPPAKPAGKAQTAAADPIDRGDGAAPAAVETPGAVAALEVAPVPETYVHGPDDQQRLTAGMVAVHGGDYEVARARLLPLARAGMAEAQYQLGLLHGRPDYEAGDRAEAFVWLTLAADRGHEEAARARLGLLQRMSGEERLRSHALLKAFRGPS